MTGVRLDQSKEATVSGFGVHRERVYAAESARPEACRVVSNNPIPDCPGHFVLTVYSPRQAALCRPGQFANIMVSSGYCPLVRRPFSYFLADEASGEISFLYRVVGEGTRLMSGLRPGQEVDVLGPLGNAFPLPEAHQAHAVIVAGGIGAGPFPPLITRLRQRGARVTALVGGRSRSFVVGQTEFRAAGADVRVTTDDGSLGRHALVTRLLEEELSVGGVDVVYACGPTPMLRRVRSICLEAGVPGYLSLEERMGCGFGVCLGCVCERQDAGGYPRYYRMCLDGPVFSCEEVVLP